ncbi:type III-B CRISPR-associated protein Cas10/Cmr2 [Acrocarpospora sp. B8E8]|uniref:type III-B CRISPR-associated protein Cas10/Cmr2 n=1 Tax=Acrocarpospora sp. B8E8 TaxID=3153572 RepID=UPI00325F108E
MPEGDVLRRDLVVAAIPGVQRFVAESRRTGDLFASSQIMSQLARALVEAAAGAELVLPGPGDVDSGIPNRVVALTSPGGGIELARRMREAVEARWEKFRAAANALESPGFPMVQWVVIPPLPGGYEEQWGRAQELLAERKRSRNFVFAPLPQERICSLTGRWPAARVPADARRVKPGEFLSGIGLIKRQRARGARFPSTWSIASAPYRGDVISLAQSRPECREAIGDLCAAVQLLEEFFDGEERAELRRGGGALPGLRPSSDEVVDWLREVEGAWCVPGTWEPESLRREYGLAARPGREICEPGREAASTLRSLMKAEAGAASLTPYLAVLAQDADQLGRTLGDSSRSAGPFRDWHGRVSGALAEAGRAQRAVIESADCLGRVVYAGGDDVLALLPAATALRAAQRSAAAFRDALSGAVGGETPTVSTALVFFHASSPLQSAVSRAQLLLKEAKACMRPGLAVAVHHRGGERARWVSAWSDGEVALLAHLETLVTAMTGEGTLSARLAIGVERDADALAALSPRWLRRELARRAVRHGLPEEAGAALYALSVPRGDHIEIPVDALLVARFLAAEGGR